MVVNKIIIATTAICRIEIHNQSFNSYLKFLDKIKNNYEIKWIINLDKPDYCVDDVDGTKLNLENILKNYNIKITNTNNPNFLNAVKNLLENIYLEMTDNCCLLWLEDDWVANDTFDLEYIINNLLKPNSFIGFVYNMLGSFPPFIMGSELIKKYVDIFIKNKRVDNPEKLSRHTLRFLTNSYGIKYFSCFDKKYVEIIKSNNNLSNLLNDNKFKYEESYLKISDNNILVPEHNDIYYFKNYLNINMMTVDEYKNNNYDEILFIRFGFVDMHKKYKYSFFKDIGRDWKKNKSI